MNTQQDHLSAEALTTWLVDEIARRLEVTRERVDTEAEFDELGLDSVQAVALSGELSDKVGEELPATLLYEHRNIRELARHLASAAAPAPAPAKDHTSSAEGAQ